MTSDMLTPTLRLEKFVKMSGAWGESQVYSVADYKETVMWLIVSDG